VTMSPAVSKKDALLDILCLRGVVEEINSSYTGPERRRQKIALQVTSGPGLCLDVADFAGEFAAYAELPEKVPNENWTLLCVWCLLWRYMQLPLRRTLPVEIEFMRHCQTFCEC
jgi:hypothetical protein